MRIRDITEQGRGGPITRGSNRFATGGRTIQKGSAPRGSSTSTRHLKGKAKARDIQKSAKRYYQQTKGYFNVKKWPRREMAMWKRMGKKMRSKNIGPVKKGVDGLLFGVNSFTGMASSPFRMLLGSITTYAGYNYLFNIQDWQKGNKTDEEFIKGLASSAGVELLLIVGGQKIAHLFGAAKNSAQWVHIYAEEVEKAIIGLGGVMAGVGGLVAGKRATDFNIEEKKELIKATRQLGIENNIDVSAIIAELEEELDAYE